MILHPFLSVAMKTKSSNLFNQTGSLVTVLYPTLCLCIKKNTLNYYYLKVKNFKVIVSKMRVLEKNIEAEGGVTSSAPRPPSLFILEIKLRIKGYCC